ncbi:tyrosine-type recombinase/integrase [Gordonia sp. NPDC062954]|uniref:tyrosine-type recombinase/integrase n=1 Tax=Gordonia sp. NPDC062954 TaxID=3364003 RepID=UPI0037C726B7
MGTDERRRFGSVRKLPSGRYQARYIGPDAVRYSGPRTWAAKDDALGWLRSEERLIEMDVWKSPDRRQTTERARSLTVAEYARRWNEQRAVKASTRAQYQSYLRVHFEGTELADMPVGEVTVADVREWWAEVRDTSAGKSDGATRNARVYAWLRTVFESAVEDGLLDRNPCRIKGAGVTKRQRTITVPSPAEVSTLADGMPDRLRLLVVLAAWCAMRRGELLGLRRMDVEPDGSLLYVRRGVTFVKGQPVVDTPKSGRERTVAVPPHLHAAVVEHLGEHVGKGRAALVFASVAEGNVGGIVDEWTLRYHWQAAREKIGRDDLRLHDLRHAGSMWAASAGATVPELQRRLGHQSTAAALRYMHAAESSDVAIAARLSELAGGDAP